MPVLAENKVVTQAEALFSEGHADQAVSLLREHLANNHDDVAANYALAVIEQRSGNTVIAESHFRHALRTNPESGECWYELSLIPGSLNRDDIARMQVVVESPGLGEHNQMLVAYALGIALDKLQEFDRSFEFTSSANEIQRESARYSVADQKGVFARHRENLGKSFAEYCEGYALADDTPILVLGMPRSGTTLVEQILASHPRVHGAGEVEDVRLIVEGVRKLTGKLFPLQIKDIAPPVLAQLARRYVSALQAYSPSATHIIDKLPHNFLRTGLFSALLPQTNVIVCQRDPVDNCLSIHQHYFATEHGYATDLRDLGEYYRLYSDLMDYWQQATPGRILRVQYEELIEAPEREIRRMLEHCGLPFDAKCLSYHENKRIVATPSAAQVRQALYKGSVGRSKPYTHHLRPLLEALEMNDFPGQE